LVFYYEAVQVVLEIGVAVTVAVSRAVAGIRRIEVVSDLEKSYS
jgi:hypothetical protein